MSETMACKRQLLPEEKLDNISGVLLGNIVDSLCREHVERQHGLAMSRVSLSASAPGYWWMHLLEHYSAIGFSRWSQTWYRVFLTSMMMLGCLSSTIPNPLPTSGIKARCKILQSFVNYMQSPEDVRSGRAWLIEEVMKEHKAVEIRDEDRAALLLMIYWA